MNKDLPIEKINAIGIEWKSVIELYNEISVKKGA